MVHRLLTWLFWLAASVIAGPGVAVTGDPGLDSSSAVDGRQPAVRRERLAVIAVAAAIALAAGTPPAGAAVLAIIGVVIVLAAR